MRAIVDWYFTAHPPIIHDLHEAQALMYTYSGGPPQNPNLDPLLFAELPWFSNWELAQMTKWGMPGVYTHAFMDGWSPGYLGSVAYNHNGMMRMYETQSGRENAPPRGRDERDGRGSRRRQRSEWRRDTAGVGDAAAEAGRRAAAARRTATATPAIANPFAGRAAGAPGALGGAPGGGRAPAVPTGRGGGQPREWYRGIPIPPNAVQKFSRRDNTNYMETGVLSALQLTAMFPKLILRELLYQDAEFARGRRARRRRTATSSPSSAT